MDDIQNTKTEKALRLLEFPVIRERLATYTSFAGGRELALRLAPSFDPHQVLEWQAETAEARALGDTRPDLSLAGAEDVRPLVERAALDGVLEGLELQQIADTLATIREARRIATTQRDHAPGLAHLAHTIPVARNLEQEIHRCIGRRGEVLDTASPELRRARTEAHAAYDRLHTTLDRLVTSALGQEVLQESLITFRNDRLVVPVKTELRRRLPGLVHDTSDSGATLFVEPLATVALGNAYREHKTAEEREELRVRRHLSTLVAQQADRIAEAVALAARLDLALAKAAYARAIQARPPQLYLPDPNTPTKGPYLDLVEARHPLLHGHVVPISLAVGGDCSVLLITGPNTGGKTVSLKTAGLLTLMAQAGLQVPASAESSLTPFDGVFADIGDEQSIEYSVSTFSSHMQNIVAILHQATPRSLVLLDELGTSTDPDEGSALARAVLAHLAHRGISTVATTHHRGIAAFVHDTPGMLNASVELDPHTLAPTYRLRLGLPGRSYAMTIAQRLGLPSEVLEAAREFLGQLQAQMEDLLSEVQRQREALEGDAKELARAQGEVERMRRQLQEQLAGLEDRREELLEETRREGQRRVEELLERLRQIERQLQQAASAHVLEEARRDIQRVRRELRPAQWSPSPRQTPSWRETLQVGDTVRIKGFARPATVLAPPDAEGLLEVMLGTIRARIALGQVERREQAASAPTAPPRPSIYVTPAAEPAEVSLRGLKVEEALYRLDRFLNDAVLSGHSQVRIIHGKGTGALRQAVHQELARHSLVKSFALAEPWEGGDGVTVAELA